MNSQKKTKFELELLSNAIVDLYISLKNRTVRGTEGAEEEYDRENERHKLLQLGNIVLINYIKSFFEIILSQLDRTAA
jgi:hypothetical protein